MARGSVVEAPRPRSGAETKRIIELSRIGEPYLVLRDRTDTQVEVPLEPFRALAIGRDEQCELFLGWDGAVSQLHAELVCRAGAWTILDDGLSRNGTYVNGERVHGRRRLRDGDVLCFGDTAVLFRDPRASAKTETTGSTPDQPSVRVSPAQRRVLVELCRPLADGSGVVPATNRAIASVLVLSDEAVKSHMRALFGLFGLGHLPQNAKRVRLVDLVLRAGIVGPRDL